MGFALLSLSMGCFFARMGCFVSEAGPSIAKQPLACFPASLEAGKQGSNPSVVVVVVVVVASLQLQLQLQLQLMGCQRKQPVGKAWVTPSKPLLMLFLALAKQPYGLLR